MKAVLAAVTALAVLTACQWTPAPPDTRETVNFASDPRILRGVWTGQVPVDAAAPSMLTLNLTATYQSDSSYTVTGTATLDGRTSDVEGGVNGFGQYRYLRPQTSPVPSGLSLRFTGIGGTFLSCPVVQQTADGVKWSCEYHGTTGSTVFTLIKGIP
ncbi:hypothetical protein HNQ07_004416 [Deinococcus metalli]|uniref:Uncharacterized protein n=1 Tax=Deinococcus metalli TaxID=1141878 RepID=A0A7W8KIP5_9DEIO|nr:hypothetical protein [Deinococcus metalli]MBB5378909.1 hypothetical protein [Deinococcus metalli]GHF62669.1 hypothetical protein GCM10017781_43360 [Deinococcus metalli]